MLGLENSNFDISGDVNHNDTWIGLMHPQYKEIASTHFEALLKNPKGLYENNFRMKHKNGEWIWAR